MDWKNTFLWVKLERACHSNLNAQILSENHEFFFFIFIYEKNCNLNSSLLSILWQNVEVCTELESRERMGWKAATPLTLTHLPFRLKWNGKDCQAGYALRQLSIENSLNWAVPELACPAELTRGKRKARAKSEKHARRGVRLLPFRVSYPSCTPLACFRSPENRQKMQDWSLIVFRMSLWSRVSLPLPTGEFLIKNIDWNVEGNYSIDFFNLFSLK